eukprot:scaffold1387_cov260-Pinguiococcus_pyrenoidosus.AAC.16
MGKAAPTRSFVFCAYLPDWSSSEGAEDGHSAKQSGHDPHGSRSTHKDAANASTRKHPQQGDAVVIHQ